MRVLFWSLVALGAAILVLDQVNRSRLHESIITRGQDPSGHRWLITSSAAETLVEHDPECPADSLPWLNQVQDPKGRPPLASFWQPDTLVVAADSSGLEP